MRNAVLLFVLLSGCRTELLDPQDLATVDHATSPTDLATRVDQAAADQAMCSAHVRQPVVLDGMRVLGGDDAVFQGRVIRLELTYRLAAGCEVPADVELSAQLGDAIDVFTLTAQVWRSSSGCGASLPHTRVFELPSDQVSNFKVLVRDGAPMGSASATLFVAPNAESSCAAKGLGDPCARDCQCQAGNARARCVTLEANQTVCAVSCTGDAECSGLPMRPACTPSGDFICTPLDASICRGDADCPVGQQAVECVCRPRQTIGPALCNCDADCEAGLICAGAGGESGCIHPCSTERDCPDALGEFPSCAQGMCVLTI